MCARTEVLRFKTKCPAAVLQPLFPLTLITTDLEKLLYVCCCKCTIDWQSQEPVVTSVRENNHRQKPFSLRA